jgi:hypothetical protein
MQRVLPDLKTGDDQKKDENGVEDSIPETLVKLENIHLNVKKKRYSY